MENRTEVILSQFSESWKSTNDVLEDLVYNYSWFHLEPILKFISELKEKGEDNYFRLGTSIGRLIISRSVNHGLRKDQKYIIIEPCDKIFKVALRDGNKTYREYFLKKLDDERLSKLLQTLKSTLVD